MVGKSHDDYWLINERNQVVIANRDPRIAGSNTPPEYLSVSKLAKIQDVLNLGINNLDRNTLSWNGNDFTAKNDRADHVSISGRIVEGDGISPKSLEYTYLGVRRLVNYYYEADPNRPVWCPHLIVVAAVTSSFGNIKPRTNSIETLTLGKADVGEIGYVFTDFYLGNLDMGNLIVYSNGVGNMLVGTNFERIANTPPTFNVSFKNRGLIKAFFFGFLIVIPLVFGWYVARRRSNVLKSGKTT